MNSVRFASILRSSVADLWHFGVDQCLWLMDADADPFIFIIDLQDANQKIIFYWLKDPDPDPDPHLWLLDPDPAPGGPKTRESGWSATLVWSLRIIWFVFSSILYKLGLIMLFSIRSCKDLNLVCFASIFLSSWIKKIHFASPCKNFRLRTVHSLRSFTVSVQELFVSYCSFTILV
jgi:hypothetical protein